MKKLAKRIAALIFMFALVASMMVVPSSADYKTWDRGAVNVRINTGSPTPSWPRHTVIVVRNASYSNSIYIGKLVRIPHYTGGESLEELPPQTNRVFYVTGNWANYYIEVQVGLGVLDVCTFDRGRIYEVP